MLSLPANPHRPDVLRLARVAMGGLCAWALSACALGPAQPQSSPRPETLVAVNDMGELIRFNAGQPGKLLQRQPLKGLAPGERLVGIDYRVARGVLYALSTSGVLYTVQTQTGQLTRVGNAPPVALAGQRFGFDFNPAADRIRVVSDSGQNLRLNPDTGALAATDPAVRLPDGSVQLGGAAYTYNKLDDKLTTNFAIDLTHGHLQVQGSREGATPVVSPNTGTLTVVGALGTGPLDDAAFDIADLNNAAYMTTRRAGRTELHEINLMTGRATRIGPVGDGRALWGMAIVP